ncbi:unnamed protein product [marine sediment metagenome]|uniref:Uncharacterized protein n=1 Tax=marine sediment metagenome TaxID=412755 RepID=X1F5V9_9ZZZZ
MGKSSDNEKKFKGLCVNCDHRETCTFTKPEGGVLYCNEHECGTNEIKGQAPPQPKSQTIPKKDEKKFKGLCVNCDQRETCTFTKPEGGVLSCREYH